MRIVDRKLGECYLEVHVDSFSAVDSFLVRGYTMTFGDRDLTDEELDYLQNEHAGDIQFFSMLNGSRNP